LKEDKEDEEEDVNAFDLKGEDDVISKNVGLASSTEGEVMGDAERERARGVLGRSDG